MPYFAGRSDPTFGANLAGGRYGAWLGESTPDRCQTPKACPRVQPLAAPFGQVGTVAIYSMAGRPVTVTSVQTGLRDALARFAQDAQALVFGPGGLTLTRILWMGAYNCRCVSGTDRLSGHAYGRAIDIGGWAFQKGGDPVQTVVYERAVGRQAWVPLFRVGACLHLNFEQVLDWTHAGHHNHFHAEIGSPATRAYWSFLDRCLSRSLGAALPALGWVRAAGGYRPGPGTVAARMAALREYSRRAPAARALYQSRFGGAPGNNARDLSRLALLGVARFGFRLQ